MRYSVKKKQECLQGKWFHMLSCQDLTDEYPSINFGQSNYSTNVLTSLPLEIATSLQATFDNNLGINLLFEKKVKMKAN